MISRLVTVDLVLTACSRLRHRPEYSELDLQQLCGCATSILNTWAQAIEMRGLAVSLETIVENAFSQLGPEFTLDSLLETGNALIQEAGQIECYLSARSLQTIDYALVSGLETALDDKETIKWFTAAKQIIGAKNPTDASRSLRSLLAWLPSFVGASNDSTLQEKLNQILNNKKPKIPKAFVSLLRSNYYWRYKKHKKTVSKPTKRHNSQRRKKIV
jgi:hypothetical protein